MQIGTAMGLAVTEMGGILLPVEVATMVGRGELIVTGNIQDVMRESAIAALSYIRTRAEELQIDPNFQDGTDLHIHLPENALPKDGPSAGITIAVALISALTGRPVQPGVALTGEITLRGRVLAIGGLKEKALAAYHANIYHMVIPAENKKDLAEIPTKIRQRMRFTIVDTMDQVIDAALLAAPLDENASEESFPELPPLQVDERSSTKRKNHRRPDNTPADEKPGENGNERSPFILPPGDHIGGDSYPHLQAKDEESEM
jgi:ATP-dependent Lon protease